MDHDRMWGGKYHERVERGGAQGCVGQRGWLELGFAKTAGCLDGGGRSILMGGEGAQKQGHGGDIAWKGHTAGGMQSMVRDSLHLERFLFIALSANPPRLDFLEGR